MSVRKAVEKKLKDENYQVKKSNRKVMLEYDKELIYALFDSGLGMADIIVKLKQLSYRWSKDRIIEVIRERKEQLNYEFTGKVNNTRKIVLSTFDPRHVITLTYSALYEQLATAYVENDADKIAKLSSALLRLLKEAKALPKDTKDELKALFELEDKEDEQKEESTVSKTEL